MKSATATHALTRSCAPRERRLAEILLEALRRSSAHLTTPLKFMLTHGSGDALSRATASQRRSATPNTEFFSIVLSAVAVQDCLRTQRSKVRGGIRHADHRVGSRILFTIERCGLGRVEPARDCIFGIVKPETHVERMGREQTRGWVKAEDLIEQDGIDRDLSVAQIVGLDVSLIPR